MTPNEIIQGLITAGPGRFPRAALMAAVEQREAVTPWLLDELRRQIDARFAPALATEGYWLHLFAIYLLAYFREPAAYPLFVEMGTLPTDTLYDALGDALTESYQGQLAAVCHGDTRGIERLIEDPSLNEYVRTAGLCALVILVGIGELDPETLKGYLGRLAGRWLEAAEAGQETSDADAWVWATLVWLAADLDAQTLVPTIRRAFDLGLVDTWFGGGLDDFERAMARGPDRKQHSMFAIKTGLPGHPVDELEHWACFEVPESRMPESPVRRPAPVHVSARAAKKVGRNEPCPCGSGKKYKKCCGR